MSVLLQVVKEAARYVGVREIGANRGKDIERFQAHVGLKPGDPWCAAFVSYILTAAASEAKVKQSPIQSGSAVQLYFLARRNGLEVVTRGAKDFRMVEPGWIWVRAASEKEAQAAVDRRVWCKGHTGIVTTPVNSSGRFDTIEGNTNPAGSREGDGCYTKTQTVLDPRLVAFLRPFPSEG